jgi:hypothetical protein
MPNSGVKRFELANYTTIREIENAWEKTEDQRPSVAYPGFFWGGFYTRNFVVGGRGLDQEFFRGVLHQDFCCWGGLHQEFVLGGVTPGIFRGVLHQEFVCFFWGGGFNKCSCGERAERMGIWGR